MILAILFCIMVGSLLGAVVAIHLLKRATREWDEVHQKFMEDNFPEYCRRMNNDPWDWLKDNFEPPQKRVS